MKLPVLKDVEYLSPSSMQEMENCDYAFYLKRMAGLAWPDYVQGVAAAIGSAFDSYVKHALAEELGLGNDPRFSVDNLINATVDEENRSAAVPMGQLIFKHYQSSGMYQSLLDEGLGSIELDSRKPIVVGDTEIPFVGKPDAALIDATIVDWKVQGSASKHGASPTPGYAYGKRGFNKLGAHKRCGEPLENLNDKWALQLAIYSWLYTGIEPFRDIPVAIENVSVRSGKYTFTSIRTHITAEYQKQVWERAKAAWHKAQTGEINDPMPNSRKCFPYNTRCPMADNCEAFQTWQSQAAEGVDPERSAILGR